MSRSIHNRQMGLKRRKIGRGIWAGLTCGGMALLSMSLGSCARQKHEGPCVLVSLSNPAKPQPSRADPIASLRTTSFGPMSYFDNSCARCHGPYGSFYGPTFGKDLKDTAALRRVIDEMARGPGADPLNDSELDQQTAYHQSLIDGKPFINLMAVEVAEGQITLWGEVTPGAKVYVSTDGDSIQATMDGHRWTARYPLKGLWVPMGLLATFNGQTTEIDPHQTAWSHQAK